MIGILLTAAGLGIMNSIPLGMFKGMMSRMSSAESQGNCDS